MASSLLFYIKWNQANVFKKIFDSYLEVKQDKLDTKN